ncbi:MAG: hypothetical protein WDO70_06075 [Alphaproteobacteria bacterium]
MRKETRILFAGALFAAGLTIYHSTGTHEADRKLADIQNSCRNMFAYSADMGVSQNSGLKPVCTPYELLQMLKNGEPLAGVQRSVIIVAQERLEHDGWRKTVAVILLLSALPWMIVLFAGGYKSLRELSETLKEVWAKVLRELGS